MSTSNRHEIANSVMSLIHNRDERRLDAKKTKTKKTSYHQDVCAGSVL